MKKKSNKTQKANWKTGLKVAVFIILFLIGLSIIFPNMVRNYSEPTFNSFKQSASRSIAMDGAGEMAMMEAASSYRGDLDESFGSMISPIPPVPGNNGIAPGQSERHIIQTGNLSVIVEDVEKSIQEIKKITTSKWKGIIAEANIHETSEDSHSGWIRIRVPAESFDKLFTDIKNLADRVESESISADDVTRQVIDNKARLNNFQQEEKQYLEILKSAKSVEDTLQVTREINRVRGQIERIETQLKNLNEQVAYSTIHVNLVDQGDVKVFGIYWKPLLEAKQALRGALQNVTGSINSLMAIIFNLPLLIVWGLILFLFGKYSLKFGHKIWESMSKK